MKNKTCLVIVGPTAVGKTSVASELAQHYNTQIISADSRQCYKELNIGVAKPSADYLQKIKHWFINSHTIQEDVNAKVFEDYAIQKVNEIFKNHELAIMVGGTGLYIKSFCDGIDEVPQINAEIRKVIVTNYNNNGIEWLSKEVKKYDQKYFSTGEVKNPQRMIRALEVKQSTGRSILEFQSHKKRKEILILSRSGWNYQKNNSIKTLAIG